MRACWSHRHDGAARSGPPLHSAQLTAARHPHATRRTPTESNLRGFTRDLLRNEQGHDGLRTAVCHTATAIRTTDPHVSFPAVPFALRSGRVAEAVSVCDPVLPLFEGDSTLSHLVLEFWPSELSTLPPLSLASGVRAAQNPTRSWPLPANTPAREAAVSLALYTLPDSRIESIHGGNRYEAFDAASSKMILVVRLV
jgi:hypothetical protein